MLPIIACFVAKYWNDAAWCLLLSVGGDADLTAATAVAAVRLVVRLVVLLVVQLVVLLVVSSRDASLHLDFEGSDAQARVFKYHINKYLADILIVTVERSSVTQ